MTEFFLAWIQGITELLPISSSLHLSLWGGSTNLDLALALHAGSGLGLCARLGPYVCDLFRPQAKTLWIQGLIATLPIGIVGYVLDVYGLRALLDNAAGLGTFSIIGGSLIILADRWSSGKFPWTKLQGKRLVIWSFSQIPGLFSGVSRLGTAIVMGRFLSLRRKDAALWGYISGLWVLGATTSWLLLKTACYGSMSTLFSPHLLGAMVVTASVTYVFYPWALRLMATPQGLMVLGGYRIILGALVLVKEYVIK